MKNSILAILVLAACSLALDVNTSPIKDIQDSVPGIGPKIGANLDEYRKTTPIKSCDDLQQVKGIGTKKAAVACPLLHLSGVGRSMPIAFSSRHHAAGVQAKRGRKAGSSKKHKK